MRILLTILAILALGGAALAKLRRKKDGGTYA
jgi:hypothetical protein